MVASWVEVTQVRARPTAAAHRVLIVDRSPEARRWLRAILAGAFDLEECDHGDLALDRIAAGLPRLLVVGPQLADMTGGELLARAVQWLGDRDAPVTFLLAGPDGAFAEVDEGQVPIFYRLVPTMQADRIRGLLTQAAQKVAPRPPAAQLAPGLAAVVAEHVTRMGAAQELPEAAAAACASIASLIGVARARCVFHDEGSGSLWTADDDEAQEFTAHASSGLTGFAVRAAAGLILPRVGADPLYLAAIDDPPGRGDERLALQPVFGLDGHVHAVLSAVRAADQPPFDEHELALLEALATAWTPYVDHLAMRMEAEAILGDALEQPAKEMFRQEALQHLVKRGVRGDVVRVNPAWVRAAYWLVLASLAGAVAFGALAHVHAYTEGPAVVRFTGRTEVVAFDSGSISRLEVAAGQSVKAGQVLARMRDLEQAALLRSLDTEFEHKLVAYLQTPSDKGVRDALGPIVSQRENAQAKLESRVIRAPKDGVIKEVLVRDGQRVEPGKVLLTIVEHGTTEGLTVLAFLPGSDRPRLRAHQHLRLTIPGYRGAELGGEVRAISAEVLGATEARTRFLGERLGDSLPLTGTVVVVEARLASAEFEADGQKFSLHDGMLGAAEIQLESRSVLQTVIPGLR
jgi:multidrug efflux pump subunit AcrA (membrane-fusion protein)/CheY-like chemotaxis protein